MMVDAVADGALMRKDRDEAYELLEEMASNDYQWQTERATSEKVVGMHGPNDITAIHVQLASLTKQVRALNQQQQPSEMNTSLETIMEQLATTMHAFMVNTETKIENHKSLIRKQASSIHNQEVQVGQISNLLSARTQGSLPSNTDKIPKEQVHVIILRSGKQLKQVQKESSKIIHQKDIGEEAEDSQRK